MWTFEHMVQDISRVTVVVVASVIMLEQSPESDSRQGIQVGMQWRTVRKEGCSYDVAHDGTGTAAVLALKSDPGYEHVASAYTRPRLLSIECSSSNKYEIGPRQLPAEFKIQVVYPQVAAVDHQPGFAYHQEALPGLERQHVSGDVGREI